MIPISDFIGHFERIWMESPVDFPRFEKKYSEKEQQSREDYFTGFQQKINGLRSVKRLETLRRSDPAKTFFPVFKSFLQLVFDFEPRQLEIILSEKFKNVSRDFYYKAREFAPEFSPENIYQGLRNVWIMNGIQLMMGLPVKITPSVFAYSMIYPYSDNFLDDPAITTDEKKQFSKRFYSRLQGDFVIPASFTEQQLFRLVEMFEEEYPRTEFPKVYESLYAIHRGQTKSLQLNCFEPLSHSEIRNICFEKGGASVLADGYLVAGRLTAKQEQALFGYGVYLQLLDDIQDIKEDQDSATRTIFSSFQKDFLDVFANKTVHFGRKAISEMLCFGGDEIEIFLQLMNHSIETMLIESVGLNEKNFSPEFISEIEKSSPLRFEFLRKKRAQSKSQRFQVFQKYFNEYRPEPEPVSEI